MADTATVEKTDSTIVTTEIKEEAKPEEKLFPTPEQKAAADATAKAEADKAIADKAASDKAAANKAVAEKQTQEKTATETKAPTEKTKSEAQTTQTTSQTDYVLTLPENSLLSAEDLATIQKEAKESGLSKEEAEEVLKSQNLVATNTAARVKAQQESAFKAEQAAWKDALAKDPEMGGEHFNETVALASRAFKATASPALQRLVDQTGLGSHPEYVRQMAKIGRMMGEDKIVLGTVGDSPAAKSREEILYGKTTPGADGKLST